MEKNSDINIILDMDNDDCYPDIKEWAIQYNNIKNFNDKLKETLSLKKDAIKIKI